MKHIVIVGPHAAGKDSIIKELVRRNPLTFYRVIFTTTRAPRAGEMPGMDHNFVSETEFRAKIASGKMAFWGQMPGYLVGTEVSQLKSGDILLHNMFLEPAKQLESWGPVFRIAINAPTEDKIKRIMARESLTAEEAKAKLLKDPRANIAEQYDQFDLVVNIPDRNFEKTVSIIEKALGKFIKGS